MNQQAWRVVGTSWLPVSDAIERSNQRNMFECEHSGMSVDVSVVPS